MCFQKSSLGTDLRRFQKINKDLLVVPGQDSYSALFWLNPETWDFQSCKRINSRIYSNLSCMSCVRQSTPATRNTRQANVNKGLARKKCSACRVSTICPSFQIHSSGKPATVGKMFSTTCKNNDVY